MRILIVEDDKYINDIVTRKLKKELFFVDNCFDGLDAINYLKMYSYDVIVLDILLPGIDGLEILKTLRGLDIKTPVIMLTAKDTIEDRVRGLELGADDYLIKPFAFVELLARIKVLIRRNTNTITNQLKIADLVMDNSSRTVKSGNIDIQLTSKEFDILEYLLINNGIVLNRDKISQHLWGYEYEGNSNVIDVFIRYLRKKIDDQHEIKLIHTIRGVGYVLKVEE